MSHSHGVLRPALSSRLLEGSCRPPSAESLETIHKIVSVDAALSPLSARGAKPAQQGGGAQQGRPHGSVGSETFFLEAGTASISHSHYTEPPCEPLGLGILQECSIPGWAGRQRP